MSWRPRCPRCDGTDLEEKVSIEGGYDEQLRATHECRFCKERFLVVPPDRALVARKEETACAG